MVRTAHQMSGQPPVPAPTRPPPSSLSTPASMDEFSSTQAQQAYKQHRPRFVLWRSLTRRSNASVDCAEEKIESSSSATTTSPQERKDHSPARSFVRISLLFCHLSALVLDAKHHYEPIIEACVSHCRLGISTYSNLREKKTVLRLAAGLRDIQVFDVTQVGGEWIPTATTVPSSTATNILNDGRVLIVEGMGEMPEEKPRSSVPSKPVQHYTPYASTPMGASASYERGREGFAVFPPDYPFRNNNKNSNRFPSMNSPSVLLMSQQLSRSGMASSSVYTPMMSHLYPPTHMQTPTHSHMRHRFPILLSDDTNVLDFTPITTSAATTARDRRAAPSVWDHRHSYPYDPQASSSSSLSSYDLISFRFEEILSTDQSQVPSVRVRLKLQKLRVYPLASPSDADNEETVEVDDDATERDNGKEKEEDGGTTHNKKEKNMGRRCNKGNALQRLANVMNSDGGMVGVSSSARSRLKKMSHTQIMWLYSFLKVVKMRKQQLMRGCGSIAGCMALRYARWEQWVDRCALWQSHTTTFWLKWRDLSFYLQSMLRKLVVNVSDVVISVQTDIIIPNLSPPPPPISPSYSGSSTSFPSQRWLGVDVVVPRVMVASLESQRGFPYGCLVLKAEMLGVQAFLVNIPSPSASSSSSSSSSSPSSSQEVRNAFSVVAPYLRDVCCRRMFQVGKLAARVVSRLNRAQASPLLQSVDSYVDSVNIYVSLANTRHVTQLLQYISATSSRASHKRQSAHRSEPTSFPSSTKADMPIRVMNVLISRTSFHLSDFNDAPLLQTEVKQTGLSINQRLCGLSSIVFRVSSLQMLFVDAESEAQEATSNSPPRYVLFCARDSRGKEEGLQSGMIRHFFGHAS